MANSTPDPPPDPSLRDQHEQPRRPRLTNHDDIQFPLARSADTWAYPSLMRSHSTTSLASSLRHLSVAGAADDEDLGPPRWGDYPEGRRRLEDERRVTQILADPQLRSKMLIGHEDNRYQWHRYWTTEAELGEMRKPMLVLLFRACFGPER